MTDRETNTNVSMCEGLKWCLQLCLAEWLARVVESIKTSVRPKRNFQFWQKQKYPGEKVTETELKLNILPNQTISAKSAHFGQKWQFLPNNGSFGNIILAKRAFCSNVKVEIWEKLMNYATFLAETANIWLKLPFSAKISWCGQISGSNRQQN